MLQTLLLLLLLSAPLFPIIAAMARRANIFNCPFRLADLVSRGFNVNDPLPAPDGDGSSIVLPLAIIIVVVYWYNSSALGQNTNVIQLRAKGCLSKF